MGPTGTGVPQLMLGLSGPQFPGMLNKIGETHKDDPDVKYQKQTEFVDAIDAWENDIARNNSGGYTKSLRETVESSRKSKPGDSLITGNDNPRRKKIYGMGKSSDKEKSGTVKKPTLGGE